MLRKDDSRHHELVRYRKGKLYLKLASTDPEGTNVAFPLYISPLFMFFPRPRSTRDQGGGELTSTSSVSKKCMSLSLCLTLILNGVMGYHQN